MYGSRCLLYILLSNLKYILLKAMFYTVFPFFLLWGLKSPFFSCNVRTKCKWQYIMSNSYSWKKESYDTKILVSTKLFYINKFFCNNALHYFLFLCRTQRRPVSPEVDEKCQKILQRIAPHYEYHGISIKSCYEDFDRHNIGTVTESQVNRFLLGRSYPKFAD